MGTVFVGTGAVSENPTRGIPSGTYNNSSTYKMKGSSTISRPPFDTVPPSDNVFLQAQIYSISHNSFYLIFVLPLRSTAVNFD